MGEGRKLSVYGSMYKNIQSIADHVHLASKQTFLDTFIYHRFLGIIDQYSRHNSKCAASDRINAEDNQNLYIELSKCYFAARCAAHAIASSLAQCMFLLVKIVF